MDGHVEAVIIGGRYALEELLGEGNFGEVWAAQDLRTGARVAVKRLLPSHHESTRARGRFEREAAIVRTLEHPNIAAAYDVVEHEGGLALVLQYVEGHTLRRELRRRVRDVRSVPAKAVLSLAFELASGLAYAHERGVIHRDLKPANVMLTPSGRAVILDFGLARFYESEDQEGGTTIGRVLGTPMYMPPEQALGEPVGPASDAFALACVLFEAATLHYAWLRDDHDALITLDTPVRGELRARNAHGAIAARIASSPKRLDLTTWRPELPSALLSWVERASAAQAHERPSVRELLAALSDEQPRVWTPPPDTLLPGALELEQTADAIATPRAVAAPQLQRSGLAPDRIYVALAVTMATLGLALAWLLLRAAPVDLAEVTGPPPSVHATASPHARSTRPSMPSAEAAPRATRLRFERTTIMRGCVGERDPDCGNDERPARRVDVAGFALDRTEVTAGAYAECVERGACTPADTREAHCTGGRADRRDHPINCVDAAQAAAFCAAVGGRLPDASEWERAARGPRGGRFPWGDEDASCAYANLGGCGGRTTRVGSRARDANEVADLAGNVWEWTADGTPTRREIRGGSFYDLPPALRSSNRGWADARTRIEQLGFRCAYALAAE